MLGPASTTVTAVISAETVGTGARVESGACVIGGGRTIFATGRAAEGGRVDRTVSRDLHRVYFLEGGVDQHECLVPD